MNKTSAYVYMWANKVTGDRYIGKGSRRRAWQHLPLALGGSRLSPKFYAAIRKHSPEAFELGFIALGLAHDVALQVERAFVAMYRPEYNLTAGGEGAAGRIVSLETRAKMSVKAAGRVPSIETRRRLREAARQPHVVAAKSARHAGKTISEQQKALISELFKGKPKRPETRQAIAESLLGKTKSPEHIAAMRAARWPNGPTPKTPKVKQQSARSLARAEVLETAVASFTGGSAFAHARAHGVALPRLQSALVDKGWRRHGRGRHSHWERTTTKDAK